MSALHAQSSWRVCKDSECSYWSHGCPVHDMHFLYLNVKLWSGFILTVFVLLDRFLLLYVLSDVNYSSALPRGEHVETYSNDFMK